MKKYLIFLVMMLSHFSINAEGIDLNCSPIISNCSNCSEFQTLFPVEELSSSSDSLDVEADESEIQNDKYLLSGKVKVSSEDLYLSADNVEVSSLDNSIIASGNVNFQDASYLIIGSSLSAKRENDNLTAIVTQANYQDYAVGLGGANGYTDIIEKTPSNILLTNSTYSL
jgi:LPS-assembly protein